MAVPKTAALPLGDAPAEDSLSPVAPWRVVNIGGGQPVGLMSFIKTIERHLGEKAEMIMLPMQKGDVTETFADASLLAALNGAKSMTTVDEGVKALVEWYRNEMKV